MRRRVAAAAVVLACTAAAASVEAQRPGARAVSGAEWAFLVGGSQLDIDDLNARFATAGYPTFDNQYLALGFVSSRAREDFRLGFEIAGVTRGTQATADNQWRTQTGGAYAMLNLGYEALREGGLSVVPKLGIGAGAFTIGITDRTAPSFDEILAQPGRGVNLSSASLLLDGSIGLRYRIGREPAAGQRAFMVGVRAGYMTSVLHGEWTRENALDAPGGPTAGWGGPHFELLIGRTTRR